MEGLKKNLHFVVLGAGVLIGAVLMVVGIMVKSGKEKDIASSIAGLSKHVAKNSALPTKKDNELVKRKKDAFEKEFEGSLQALEKGPGVALTTDAKTYRDGAAFYSEEGDALVKNLMARFARMEKEPELPEVLGGRKLAASQPVMFWKSLQDQMNSIADPKAIPSFQKQLRVMHEVCFTCEKLLELDAFRGQGVRLVDFKWESRGSESVSPDTPWEDHPFAIILECHPSFATALAEELANPSNLTLGNTAKAKEGQGRWAFPIEISELQMEMMERPLGASLSILNKDKAAWGIPANASSEDQVVIQKRQEIEDKLRKETQVILPVRCGIRARALTFNKNWRGVVTPKTD